MSRRPWLGFALSVAVHAALFALVVVAFSRDDWLPALVVDLREDFFPGSISAHAPSGGPGGERRAAAPARRRSRVAKQDAAPSPARGHESHEDAAPAPRPAAPSPAPVAESAPPPPQQPEPSRETPVASASLQEPAPSRSLAGAIAVDRPGPATSVTGEGPGRGEAAGGSGGSSMFSGPPASSASGAGRSGAMASDGAGEGIVGRPGQALALGTTAGGSGVGAEYGPYLATLRQRIQQSVRYPASARRRGISGTVSLEILILATGVVADVQLLESSSHRVLDDAALDTVRSLPRLPLPPELPARSLRVRVPVVFQIQ